MLEWNLETINTSQSRLSWHGDCLHFKWQMKIYRLLCKYLFNFHKYDRNRRNPAFTFRANQCVWGKRCLLVFGQHLGTQKHIQVGCRCLFIAHKPFLYTALILLNQIKVWLPIFCVVGDSVRNFRELCGIVEACIFMFTHWVSD